MTARPLPEMKLRKSPTEYQRFTARIYTLLSTEWNRVFNIANIFRMKLSKNERTRKFHLHLGEKYFNWDLLIESAKELVELWTCCLRHWCGAKNPDKIDAKHKRLVGQSVDVCVCPYMRVSKWIYLIVSACVCVCHRVECWLLIWHILTFIASSKLNNQFALILNK